MTKQERYLEEKRICEKRVNGAPKRRRRALIVRIIFTAGVAAAICLAVIGTQPKQAARLKRWAFSVTSVFRASDQPEEITVDEG